MKQKIKVSRTRNLGQSSTFFIFGAKQTFIKLRQVFVKAPILNYFDSECYIYIKTDISDFTISKILS